MAIVLSEGFGASTAIADFVTYGLFIAQVANSINTGGPLGDPYVALGGNRNYISLRPLATPLSTIYVGARFTHGSSVQGGTDTLLTLFSSGGLQQVSISVSETNFTSLTVWQGSTGNTSIGTGALNTPLSLSAWTYLEFEVVISTTVGSVTIRQAGVTVLSLTGLNTAGDATNLNVANVGFGDANNGTANAGVQVAHVYVTNSTAPNAGFLGDVRVFSRFPTANSAVQFTPTGLANNYQNAAKVPPVPSTDYNTDATALAQDTFSGPSLPSGLGNIFAVGIKSLFQASAAGGRTVGNVLISGVTTANGTAVQPPVSPSATYQCDIFNTDPNTSAAWTAADAQATTFGYKIVS